MTDNIISYQGLMPNIDKSVFIAPSADVIGDVQIGSQSGIWYQCVVRGDVNEIRIGKGSNIQDHTVIHVASLGQGTYVGDGVTVGHSAVLHACTIEDNSFIGIGAVVMDDCLIERQAMLAAGALLTPGKTVPSGELWGGSPARKLRDLNKDDLEMFAVNRQRYIDLAARYKQQYEA